MGNPSTKSGNLRQEVQDELRKMDELLENIPDLDPKYLESLRASIAKQNEALKKLVVKDSRDAVISTLSKSSSNRESMDLSLLQLKEKMCNTLIKTASIIENTIKGLTQKGRGDIVQLLELSAMGNNLQKFLNHYQSSAEDEIPKLTEAMLTKGGNGFIHRLGRSTALLEAYFNETGLDEVNNLKDTLKDSFAAVRGVVENKKVGLSLICPTLMSPIPEEKANSYRNSWASKELNRSPEIRESIVRNLRDNPSVPEGSYVLDLRYVGWNNKQTNEVIQQPEVVMYAPANWY